MENEEVVHGCSVHCSGAGGPSGLGVGWAEVEEGSQLMIEQVPIHELDDGELC